MSSLAVHESEFLDKDQPLKKESKKKPFDSLSPYFSLEMAKLHEKATRVYSFKQQKKSGTQPEVICPCCSAEIPEKAPLVSLFTKDTSSDIIKMGPAYPLIFQFLRYLMAGMGIILAVQGAYSMWENVDGERCQQQDDQNPDESPDDCSVSVLTEWAASNRDDTSADDLIASLNLSTVIIMIGFIIFYRFRMVKVEVEMQKTEVSVEEYTIFVQKLPLTATSKEIIDFFESRVSGGSAKVSKVILGFRVAEYMKLKEKLEAGEFENEKKIEVSQKLTQLEQDCLEESNNAANSLGCAFVSFEKDTHSQEAIKMFKGNIFQSIGLLQQPENRRYNNSSLVISRAFAPGEICWQNLEVSKVSKFIRMRNLLNDFYFTFIIHKQFYSFLLKQLILGILYGSFSIIIALSELQYDIRTTEVDPTKVKLITISASIIIVVINVVFCELILLLVEFESYESKTEAGITTAKKIGFVQFMNTTVVQFVAKIITNGYDIWVGGGIVEDVSLLIVTNSIILPLTQLLQIDFIVKKLLQMMFLRKPIKEKQKLAQVQVNTLFMRPQMLPEIHLAEIANSLLLTVFYSWIIPLALPAAILSMCLMYLVIKYKLLRTQSVPFYYGIMLPERVVEFYFPIFVFIYSAGCVAFEWVLYIDVNPITIVSASISFFYATLPVNDFIVKNFAKKSKIDRPTYSEAQKVGSFVSEYDRTNPVLKSQAIMQFIQITLQTEKDPAKRQKLEKFFYQEIECDQILQASADVFNNGFKQRRSYDNSQYPMIV